jgi:hypothetical protein
MRSCAILPLANIPLLHDAGYLVPQLKGGDPVSHCFMHGAKALVALAGIKVR